MRVYTAAQKARMRVTQKRWDDANKDRRRAAQRAYIVNYSEKRWANRLKRLYGITPEYYVEMILTQNGVCAICKRVCKTGKILSVDHCHSTGAVRGLLCGTCNRMIGQAVDSINLLQAGIEYLKSNRGTPIVSPMPAGILDVAGLQGAISCV